MYHRLRQNNFSRYFVFIAVFFAVLFLTITFTSDNCPVSKQYYIRESTKTLASQIEFKIPSSTQPHIENTAPKEDVFYPYNNISFSPELQELLWYACEETGCPYELALSVIWRETRYQNVNGDGGNSIGYMQIQPRWHRERMEKLGVTDLSDPLSNFRVGCDLLAELIDEYGSVEMALTCYNTGSPGKSDYATRVIEYMAEMFSVE